LGGALPGDFVTKLGLTPGADPIQPVFLAPDRPLENSVAVAWSGPACQTGRTLVVGNAPPSAPLFYALPPDLAPPPPHTVPLYDYVNTSGLHAYSLSDDRLPAGFTRVASPIALVAENPIALKFPVADYLGDLIARAGADQCLSANAGGTPVLLDASASLSSGGKIVHYFWHLPPGAACESVEGQRVTVTLPPGLFSIELEIQDDAGNVSRDTLLVSIQ
ncbi:MAG TPA: hypothetical protein VNW92_20005, partial [Polyangiaceae bacterium]|nr:hypothetical protein [Polyangiaceae bacterium]